MRAMMMTLLLLPVLAHLKLPLQLTLEPPVRTR